MVSIRPNGKNLWLHFWQRMASYLSLPFKVHLGLQVLKFYTFETWFDKTDIDMMEKGTSVSQIMKIR